MTEFCDYSNFFDAIDKYENAAEDLFEEINANLDGEITDSDEARIAQEYADRTEQLFASMNFEELDGRTIKEYLDSLTDDEFSDLLELDELYELEYFPKAIIDKIKEDSDECATILKRKLTEFDEESIGKVPNYIRLLGVCDCDDMTDIFFKTIDRVSEITEEHATPDCEYKDISEYDLDDWRYDFIAETESLVREKIQEALEASKNPDTPYKVMKYLSNLECIECRHTEVLYYLAWLASKNSEVRPEVYSLMKRAMNESEDREYLLCTFADIGDERAITFIRGFVEKNPDLIDETFLSEAIQEIDALNGDVTDLLQMYHELFNEEE